jgi:hypothetical protein
VLLFGTRHLGDHLRATAERHHVATFTVPIRAEELARALSRALNGK